MKQKAIKIHENHINDIKEDLKKLYKKKNKTIEDKQDIIDMKNQIKISMDEIKILGAKEESYQPGLNVQPYFD